MPDTEQVMKAPPQADPATRTSPHHTHPAGSPAQAHVQRPEVWGTFQERDGSNIGGPQEWGV